MKKPQTNAGRSTALRYGTAAGCVAWALVMRLSIDPYLRTQLPYVTFFMAVTMAAWFGGLGPALLSIALGFLAAGWFFLGPAHASGTASFAVSAIAYFLVALPIAFFSHALHKARENAVARQEQLERRTAELKAVMEIKEREKSRFQEVLDNLPVCVALLTQDHHVAFANRMFRERFGESDGRRCFEYIYGHAAPCEFCRTYGVLETMETHTWERAGPDGRLYQDFAFPFTDTDGSMLILNASVDITESRQAQARLAEQSALLQLARDAILVADLNGIISFWNLGAEETYGWRSDEAVGGNVHDLLKTKSFIPLDEISAIVQNQGQWEGELVHVTRSGQAVIVASRWSLQRDREGKPSAVLEINRDITDRKRAEEELRLNRHRLDLALKAGHLGNFDWDIRNNIYVLSPELQELYGVAPGQFGGKYESWESLILREDLDIARAAVQESLRTGEFQSEWRIRRATDGQVRWLAAHANVFFDTDGRPLRMIGINADITDRKRAELALAQKTAELSRSNTELQQFAYVASHDLQEPLRMVANFTQLLAERYSARLDPDAQEFIGFAVEGATRMQTLIRDLLMLSRVEMRGENFEVVRLDEALGQAVANLQMAIRENGALVSHDELPTVLADSTQMAQLFQNLIGNAIKFRSERPALIHISAVRTGKAWTFSVRDNGIGFEPECADRIFAPFQRLHTRDKYDGNGIGLGICRKIVERHHGKIWAESKPGGGSTFFFTIPAAGVPAEQPEQSVGAA
jgi:PAS domain S-box-containing protein